MNSEKAKQGAASIFGLLLLMLLAWGCIGNPDLVIFQGPKAPLDVGQNDASDSGSTVEPDAAPDAVNDTPGNDLGDDVGDGVDVDPPCTAVMGCDPAIQVSAGVNHACVVRESGKVFCWGANHFKQLGQPESVLFKSSPVEVLGLGAAASVSSGSTFTCALDRVGQVWCWGNNESLAAAGQEVRGGDAVLESIEAAQRIDLNGAPAIKISAGHRHACALVEGDAQNEVWCWGSNQQGAVNGVNAAPANRSPEHVVLPDLAGNPSAISAGTWHSCAVSSGKVYCWGRNNYLQIDTEAGVGVNFLSPRAAPIAADEHDDFIGVDAGEDHSCAWKADGAIYCWGRSDFGQLLAPDLMAGAREVSTGRSHTCLLNGQGRVSCHGNNAEYVLGTDALNSRAHEVNLGSGRMAVQLDSGQAFVCAVLDDGSVWCWGRNEASQLGNGEQTFDWNVHEIDANDVFQIALGEAHVCANTNEGLVCWGRNESAQTGSAELTLVGPRNHLSGLEGAMVSRLALGASHGCIASPSSVYCWGSNRLGQLGIQEGEGLLVSDYEADPVALDLLAVADLSAGAGHTCALRSTGERRCWGDNTYGQLGLPPSSAPQAVTAHATYGKALATGSRHSCALVLRCPASAPDLCAGICVNMEANNANCGHCTNACAQNQVCSDFGCQLQCVANTTLCEGSCVNTQNDPRHCGGCGGGCQADQICQGGQCVSGNRDVGDKGIHCWGASQGGEVGVAPRAGFAFDETTTAILEDATSLSAGAFHTCAVRSDGSVWCWGRNQNHQFGQLATANTHVPVRIAVEGVFKSVAAGTHHTCALNTGGEVYCWGGNWFGQTGAPSSKYSPPQLVPALSGVTSIAAGGATSCALTDAGRMSCWGSNLYGQLATSSVATMVGKPVRVLRLPFSAEIRSHVP
ncbi:MAG: hypothetical protein H0U74_12845 [Bradymonadaceae bacterium]|nr:hypothetical protein [Lujinxingiaceae bacterium]